MLAASFYRLARFRETLATSPATILPVAALLATVLSTTVLAIVMAAIAGPAIVTVRAFVPPPTVRAPAVVATVASPRTRTARIHRSEQMLDQHGGIHAPRQ